MLYHIPSIISPELLKVLMEMGHGDEICIADGNFPGASFAAVNNAQLVRLDGHSIPDILEAVLTLMPLDPLPAYSAFLMECPPENEVPCPIHNVYAKIISQKTDIEENKAYEKISPDSFYERAKKCYCIVTSGEKALYANILLRKGIV
jgi:L-fucose mutarotase